MMQGSEESHEGSGRVAFVTGGGRGIGKAIAIGMARVGYRVVVASTTQANNERAAEEIRAAGGQALALELDVGVEASVAQAVDHTRAAFGRIDVLVNNAGLKGGTFPPEAPPSDRRPTRPLAAHVRGQRRRSTHVRPTLCAGHA